VGSTDLVAESEVARLRHELEWLRAENGRLSRLLELRGQSTAPAPEQLSAAVSAPGLVTMASPLADKLALFADRFRARSDVYAVRWENSRKGTSGWAPAVAGGWRKGMDRRTAGYLPLTADVVYAHLAADVFLGLYPLLSDNTCWFLVADFDGPAAMLDALAYCKAARANAVPAALEISQSGRGAHVWVFFTSAIPAAVARAVGTVLVHEAMVLRGSMDLRSYDRLFPNQEVLPEGGFGNLIAAPLQRRRRDDGLTLFLDLATLEPYEDQWAYLSTLDRLSPGDAERVARRAKRAAVGTDVATMSRSDAAKVHPPLPTVVDAELGAGLSLESSQLTPAALATFKHAASMANPKFYELQRLRKSTWDTPRFIRGYDLTVDDRLVLPRGLRHTIEGIVERAGSRLALTDTRNPGREIDVVFTAELTTKQSDAASTMLAHDDGVLVAPPGSGKTVMACAVIAERATSTLWEADAGPRCLLYVHETGFRCDDVDLSSPGALAAVHRALVADDLRNAQIVDDVAAALSRGRNCLVLTRRVAHLEILASLLAARGHEALVLQGGMSTADRRAAIGRLTDAKAGDRVLVIGTTPFIGEGFDAPALDTLFLAGPISYDGLLVQCAGRVIRTAPGKDVAEVHDYHDPATPIIAVSLQRRMPGYRTLGFNRR
jgi:hypothetical protein